mgnify:CR=1 FL=1
MKIFQGEKIDFSFLFFQIKKYWYWFLLIGIFSVAIAYLYSKYSPSIFTVKSSVLLDDVSTGSRKAEELLSMMSIQSQSRINIEDEMAKLQSYSLMREVMERLNFSVTYYEVPNIWVNSFTEFVVYEAYEDAPFRIVLDPSANQLVDVPIYITPRGGNKFLLEIESKEGRIIKYDTENTIKKIPELNYSAEIEAGKVFSNEIINFELQITDSTKFLTDESKYFFTINSLDKLTVQHQNKLAVSQFSRDARILNLSIDGPVISKNLNFINTLMDVYISRDLKEKNVTGQKTVDFIQNQLSDISDSLRQAEVALENFRTSNRIMDIGFASSNVFEKLDRLEQQKSETEIRVKYFDNMLEYLENEQDISEVISPSAVGIEDPVLSSLIIELNKLNQQKSAINFNSRKDNPALQAINSQISSAKNALIENLRTLISSSKINLNYVGQKIAEIEGNIRSLPANERRLVDLQRKFDFSDKTYDFFLEKRAEAVITLATNSPDIKVLDFAKSFGPIAPNKKINYLIAIFLTGIIPLGFILVKDVTNEKILDKSDIKAQTNIPVLGVVARGSEKRIIGIVNNRTSALAESFVNIRLNLNYFAVEDRQKIIGITSNISGEGKTFFSANLCAEFAINGIRTILIGADLRKPQLFKYFKNSKHGLATYLANTSTLDETIQESGIKNLDVITSGSIPPNPAELIGSEKMKILIEQLKERYDYIVIDTPPIGFVSEYLVLKDYTNVNIYVVRYNYSNKKSLQLIDEHYKTGKIKNLNIVLNDVDFTKSYAYNYKTKGGYYYNKEKPKKFLVNINGSGKTGVKSR